ncbi:Dimer-Tnp-hAT domain-containing protein [Pyrenophora tritici-repentis]|nr:Dimer-Tnp-hAT domain-containing protein [Pyrenophora tritici-repentis]
MCHQWLVAANCGADQETYARVRQEYPGTGQWFLQKNRFRSWFDPNFCSTPLLWMNGIPGAGKTILASLVIEEAQKLQDVHIAFFYCRYQDNDKSTFLRVARGILSQLLLQDDGLLSYLYNKMSTSGQVTLSKETVAKELLEIALKAFEKLYIVIDGIDECEKDERHKIVSLFEKTWESLPQGDADQLRCLFVSQDDNIARKDFEKMPSLKVTESDTQRDIVTYVTAKSLRIKTKFDLTADRQLLIQDQIIKSADGMFLFAHLMTSYLLDQTSVAELENELSPEKIPQGSTRLEDMYLIDKHCVDLGSGEAALALLCLGYLVFEGFDVEYDELDISERVPSGYYGFLDYAYAYWSRHVDAYLRVHDTNESTLREVSESAEVFMDMYWTQPQTKTVVPKSFFARWELLKDNRNFDELVVAGYLAQRQLVALKTHATDAQAPKLCNMLTKVRECLENVVSPANATEKLRLMYGKDIFRCPKVHCVRFYSGFSTAQEREDHVLKHERSFFCSFPGCAMAILGCATLKELHKHETDFHGTFDFDDDEAEYPDLPPRTVSRGGPKSWIYRHGWAVWHRKYKKNYWLCRYCHQRRKQEACYEADSTTNAGRHLSSNKPGHSHGPNGPVPIASREGNIMGALAKSQVHIMRSKGIEVSQEVANEMAASFSTSRFQDALKDWVVADNQSLRVIETPQFRAMIAAVSPLAEALLWRSHQTLHDHIITEYNTYIPAVANYLREARSLIHVSFDNWTSTGGQYAFTGLCVHYLNSEGKLVDHLLGLPELHGAHTGNNIAAAATTILRLFGVDNARVGYFVLDNASNNDTAVESLAEEFGFIASERRLRCCCHILNLSAQLVIWGKDRSAYENEAAHLEEEEKYMDEWRKYGPVGVLFDVIASICTPQTRQLLERLQCEEAESLGVTPHIRQLVKPVKTRWNSYFNTFVRAAELHGPIDGYIECKLEEHSAATATSRRRKNREQLPAAQPRLYIREGGLNGKDWATITEYIRLLEPFAEATRLLEGRGRHGRHGAIWEVLVTFEWLLDQLEALKDRLKDVNYEDLDAPEDHLITNVNLAHCKLAEYYAKFDNAPVYYTATILHPHYKHHLSALWKVPDTHVTARDGVHYRDGWLDNNHRAFLRMWQGRKDSAATSAHTVTPPRKKPRLGISTSRSAFLQSSIEQSTRQLEASLAEDEYEIWKRQPALAEEDWLSLNPLLYWESVAGQFPILSKFAIDVLTIPAAAADCERTFSELGDMLGTRRLHMKPELISALQSLKSWKRLANKWARFLDQLGLVEREEAPLREIELKEVQEQLEGLIM